MTFSASQAFFSDTPDYCEFMTPGFGLIGYGKPPYGMNRR